MPVRQTRLPAYVHMCISPLLSWVVYVRAHQITLACRMLRAAIGMQSAENLPAGS